MARCHPHPAHPRGHETDAAVLRLHFHEELSLPDVAERLQLDFKEVRRRYRSRMRDLERLLDPEV